MQAKQVKIKSAEVQGFSVALYSEGNTYRVTVTDEGMHPRTRVFTEYAEASALFESYLQGN